MPKVKTHKGAASRFKFSGTGKLMKTRHMKSHLRRNKSKRAKRLFDDMRPVENKADAKRIGRLIPYGT